MTSPHGRPDATPTTAFEPSQAPGGPQIAFAYDRDGTCTMSEGPGLAGLGLRPGQLVGSNLRELYRDDPQALAPIERVLDANETFTYEADHAGRLLWSYHQPLRDAGGHLVGGLGIVTDITEQRFNEQVAAAYQRRLSTLAELGTALDQETPSLRSLALTAVRVATTAVADVGSLWLLEHSGGTLALTAWHHDRYSGPSTQWHADVADPILIDAGTARAERGIQRLDLSDDRQRDALLGDDRLVGFATEADLGDSLRIPLVARGSLIGVLDVARRGASDSFSDDDIELVGEIGERLSLAIDNAMLLERQRRTIEDLVKFRSLAESTSDLIGITDDDGRLVYVNAVARQLVPDLDLSSIYDELRRRADPHEVDQVVEALKRDRRWSGYLPVRVGDEEIELRGEIFPMTHPDTGAQLGLAWVAQDMSDVRRAESSLREANDQLRQFKALVETSPDFIAIAGVDGTVRYVNPPGRRLVSMPPDVDVTTTTIADYLTPEGLEASIGIEQPAVVAAGHWEGESTLRDWSGGPAIPVAIASFLVREEETGEPFALATVQRDLREHVAAERARQELSEQRAAMLSRLVAAQEAERAKIAADVHDDPVQVLAAAELRLGALDDALHRDAPHLAPVLQATRRSLTGASDRLRNLLFDLEPPELELGLGEALEASARTIFEGTSVKWGVTTETEPRALEAHQAVAFRIAREALVNARKHARARRVSIVVREERGGLVVQVRDDGRGMSDPDPEPAPGHLGLAHMRDRAALAHGTVEVESAPGQGTTVTAWLPYPDDA